MARSRNIKPGFFQNEDLAELSFSTRLLFIGLWTLADREGFLEDRPKRIKMALFPGDDVNVDKALSELQQARFIKRYTVGEGRYIEVCQFQKHQNPHHREPSSTIPKPGANKQKPQALNPCNEDKAPDKTEAGPGLALLIPDSLIPDSLIRDEKQKSSHGKRAFSVEKPDDVPDAVWTDFLAIRKAKRAPMTATALQGLAREADKAGMPITEVLSMCCERGWQGFRAEWATGTAAGGKPIDVARLVAELEAEEAARATH